MPNVGQSATLDRNNNVKLDLRIGRRSGLNLATAYCIDVLDMVPQLGFMEQVLAGTSTQCKATKSAVACYVHDSGEMQASLGTKHDHRIASLDMAFEQIPPLTKPITSYRVYNGGGIVPKEGESFFDNKYISTSLSRTFVDKCFASHAATNIVVRIDIMPGTKVLPVLDWQHWGNGNMTTEFEILLPRRAYLLAAPPRLVREFIPTDPINSPLTICTNNHGDEERNLNQMPPIDWHFIVVPEGTEGSFNCDFLHTAIRPGGAEVKCNKDASIPGSSGGPGHQGLMKPNKGDGPWKGHSGGSKTTKYKSTIVLFDTKDDMDINIPLAQKIVKIITKNNRKNKTVKRSMKKINRNRNASRRYMKKINRNRNASRRYTI